MSTQELSSQTQTSTSTTASTWVELSMTLISPNPTSRLRPISTLTPTSHITQIYFFLLRMNITQLISAYFQNHIGPKMFYILKCCKCFYQIEGMYYSDTFSCVCFLWKYLSVCFHSLQWTGCGVSWWHVLSCDANLIS